LAAKSHCDTVESIKTKLSDAMTMQCLLDGREGQSLQREESRELQIVIEDFAVVHSRSNSENLNISIQNLFKVCMCEGFQNGTLSEI